MQDDTTQSQNPIGQIEFEQFVGWMSNAATLVGPEAGVSVALRQLAMAMYNARETVPDTILGEARDEFDSVLQALEAAIQLVERQEDAVRGASGDEAGQG